MSTAEHETNRPPVDSDVEIRIRYFRNLTNVALLRFTVLIVLVGMLWLSIKTVSSTGPMPVRCAGIIIIYLYTIHENAHVFRIATVMYLSMIQMPGIEDDNRSRNRDLETRTTSLEDWILANLCVIAGLSSIGFVAWYWMAVIALTIRTFFYWACTIGILCFLSWLLKRTIRFYRKASGLKPEEAWAFLIFDTVERIRLRDVFSKVSDAGSLLHEALKGILFMIGLRIGKGPLFDRLPEELKAERRSCKSDIEVLNKFFTGFGRSAEDDLEEDVQDRNQQEESCFPPMVFEWQPNPVIHSHLRGEHSQSPYFGPPVAESRSDCHFMTTPDITTPGMTTPDMTTPDMTTLNTAVNFEDTQTPKNDWKSSGPPEHTGPTTMTANLSSFACPQCPFVARKKGKLNTHVTRTHNHPYECVYPGCGKTFGLRTNFQRHEATHTDRTGFQCPNPRCKTPKNTFTRADNLWRHTKQCGTSEEANMTY